MTKAIFSTLAAVLISIISFAQTGADQPSAASIQFEEKVHDFGTLEQYSDGSCSFTFKNKGNEPLVITKVITSCGCTVPDYPQRPIMPGQESQINVTYDTSKLGSINNQIVIRSNAEEGTITLKIKGKVVKK
jgi:outer membrane biosynthesis protein TonB